MTDEKLFRQEYGENFHVFQENTSDREIVNNLANKMLPYIVMSSDFSGKRTGSCLGDDGTNAVSQIFILASLEVYLAFSGLLQQAEIHYGL